MTSKAITPDEKVVKDAVFDLLRSEGPLCVSQIVVELLVDPEEVESALRLLQSEGCVEVRDDHLKGKVHKDCIPWGLATSFRRSARRNHDKLA